MSGVTFGSVGDIVAVCLLARDLAGCFDKTRGSASEYQVLSTELKSLDRALLEAALILDRYKNKLGSSATAIADEVSACNTSLRRLRDVVEKYDGAFREDTSVGLATKVKESLHWHFSNKEVLNKFRTEIAAHFNTLSMLLITANL